MKVVNLLNILSWKYGIWSLPQVALDNATVDNGCMWFVPGSHKKPLREHRSPAKDAHTLECDCTEVRVKKQIEKQKLENKIRTFPLPLRPFCSL
jgi:hypothetical protein